MAVEHFALLPLHPLETRTERHRHGKALLYSPIKDKKGSRELTQEDA